MIKKFKIFEQAGEGGSFGNPINDINFNNSFGKWLVNFGLGPLYPDNGTKISIIDNNRLGFSIKLDSLSNIDELTAISTFSEKYDSNFSIETYQDELYVFFWLKDLLLLHKFIEENPSIYERIPKDLKIKEIVDSWGHLDGGYEYFDNDIEDTFVYEQNKDFEYKNFEYKAIIPDKYNNPSCYITDYKIIGDDGSHITARASGYKYEKKDKKKVLVKFKDEKMKIDKKYIQEGKLRK
jgi:hypothetical protein